MLLPARAAVNQTWIRKTRAGSQVLVGGCHAGVSRPAPVTVRVLSRATLPTVTTTTTICSGVTKGQWRRNRGFGRFNEQGPELLGPEWGHTCTVHAGFSVAGEHEKHQNPWRLGTPLGELTPLPSPGTRPSTKPHLRSQHFGLPASVLGAEATKDPPSYC